MSIANRSEAAYKAFVKELDDAYKCCSTPCELKSATEGFLRELLGTLFPHFAPMGTGRSPETAQRLALLTLRLHDVLTVARMPEEEVDRVADAFFGEMPEVRANAAEDADAIMRNDPAAESVDEVVLAYPGFYAILVYRIAHVLDTLQVPIVPRLMTEYAHRETGIDIHPSAQIGVPFVIDHGTGIVIGQTTEIGSNVSIYQGVTLGAHLVNKSLASRKRHPTIEDDVVIYAGATILGGKTRVGRGSVIGGNVFLTESVQPGSVVTASHQVHVRQALSGADAVWDWVI